MSEVHACLMNASGCIRRSMSFRFRRLLPIGLSDRVESFSIGSGIRTRKLLVCAYLGPHLRNGRGGLTTLTTAPRRERSWSNLSPSEVIPSRRRTPHHGESSTPGRIKQTSRGPRPTSHRHKHPSCLITLIQTHLPHDPVWEPESSKSHPSPYPRTR